MKKEFDTLLVGDVKEKLNEQEKTYFHRMVETLKAVGVTIAELHHGCGGSGVALVSNEADLALAKEQNIPVVYYSRECVGGYGADMLLMSFYEVGFSFFQQVFDRFHGQPWTILETRRCLLREAVLSDLDVFYEIYAQPSVARFIEPLSEKREEELEKLRAYIRMQYPYYGFGTWTILEETTGQIIGRAGLNLSETTGKIQLGYLIREEYQHQGFATEVCQGILKYAREELELRELELEVHPENENSLKLAKKLGFQPVCRDAMCCILLNIYL